MDEIAVRVIVIGRVTGVGFRYCTRGEARRYPGLKGYVRNVRPGEVECLLQGCPGDVRAMQRWLRKGPENALVETFTVEEQPVLEETSPFQVKF